MEEKIRAKTDTGKWQIGLKKTKTKTAFRCSFVSTHQQPMVSRQSAKRPHDQSNLLKLPTKSPTASGSRNNLLFSSRPYTYNVILKKYEWIQEPEQRYNMPNTRCLILQHDHDHVLVFFLSVCDRVQHTSWYDMVRVSALSTPINNMSRSCGAVVKSEASGSMAYR